MISLRVDCGMQDKKYFDKLRQTQELKH